jgi:hypothetical protein
VSALLALLLCAPAPLVKEVGARLGHAAVQQGTFEQRKHVKGFKRPLKSSGTYTLSQAEGVHWNTLLPFPSQLTVTAQAITSTDGAAQTYRLEAKSEPTVRLISALLLSLLSGELSALQEHFTIEGAVRAEGFSLTLTPKTAALGALFTSIALEGDTAVRQVVLNEANGDRTEIALAPGLDGGR